MGRGGVVWKDPPFDQKPTFFSAGKKLEQGFVFSYAPHFSDHATKPCARGEDYSRRFEIHHVTGIGIISIICHASRLKPH